MRLALAVCLLTLAASASAQSPLLPPAGRSLALNVDVAWIGWDGEGVGDVGGFVGFVGVHVPFAARAAVVADVPVARVQVDGRIVSAGCGIDCLAPAQGTETFVGNPYVGMRTGQAGDPFSGEVGLRIPTLSLSGYDDEARLAVASAPAFGRREAFASRDLTLVAQGGLAHAATDWLVLRGRAGFAAAFGEPTGAALLEGAVAWRYRPVRLAATGLARFDVSDGGQPLGERAGALVGLEAMATLGRVRPALSLQFPLGEALPDALGPTVGLSLSLDLSP